MERIKQVLIVTPGFAEDENDTTNVPYLQDYILALKQKIGAQKIKIISIHFPFQTRKYMWNEIEVFPMGGKNIKGIFRIITFIRSIKKIRSFLKTKQYALHSFWFTDATLVSYFANKKYHVPHICTLMGQDVKKENRLLRFLKISKMICVAVSENQSNLFTKNTEIKPNHIIPLPIPEMNYKIEKKDIDCLFTSSLISLKHPEIFVQIIKKLHNEFPTIKAAMIGTGNLFNTIHQLIQKEKLENVIELVGKKQRPEVFKYMGRSKILVHPSEFEGQCMVYAEALAHGMYVLSNDVGRIESTEKHLVCNNTEEFYLHCKKLIQSELNFDPFISLNTNEIVSQYISIYQLE